MELSKTYDPKAIEGKWYKHWTDHKFFSSRPNPDKKPYTIVIPPPNVTGILHMGHMLNNTIQDILIRRARLQGFEACWVPGMDHASIATETKVVNMLKEKGIDKSQLSREDFLKHAWEWTDNYGGIILDQLKKLGASCDWDRTKFTMDEDMSESVIKVFSDLYEKGYIYRGVRMVNWDPKGKTAVSDEEVYHKEVNSKLYYIKYPIVGEDRYLMVATTRPETMFGDTAVCVNPDDERYRDLVGKKVLLPMVDREIPIIADDYVDIDFGTGCLKITPAHDINDYEIGMKHNLDVIDVLNEDGTVNKYAGEFEGLNRFVARKKAAQKLEEINLLEKVEEIKNNVGYSERTNEVIEPRLSAQWFCKVGEMAGPALDHVMNDDISFHPPKFKNMYRSWLENINDWCISRQLWWGHQIPAYYLPNGEVVVAETAEKAFEKAKEIDPDIKREQLKQDEDVLDTWFSSWLWPISVFDGVRHPDNEEFRYYYPTNTLVTGFDIIFFWVARMIFAGYEFEDRKPFKDVYFTGMVRDNKRRKMSKQLGNSPDPIELMKKYSADGVRIGMLLSAPAGNDLLFDEKLCEQGRNFINKLWNAFRLVKGWEVVDKPEHDDKPAIDWFESRMGQVIAEVDDHFKTFRISDALMALYKLTWDDFCSWYLEMIKPPYGEKISKATYEKTLGFLEKILQLLHPFTPFVTEELWHAIKERKEADCVTVSEWPQAEKVNNDIIKSFGRIAATVSSVRNFRKTKQIPGKELLSVTIKTSERGDFELFEQYIKKLAGIDSIDYSKERLGDFISEVVNEDEIFYTSIDPAEGIDKDKLQKDLSYYEGFLKSVSKKLSNERFVNNAPAEVVEKEKAKQEDAEAKIKAIREALSSVS